MNFANGMHFCDNRPVPFYFAEGPDRRAQQRHVRSLVHTFSLSFDLSPDMRSRPPLRLGIEQAGWYGGFVVTGIAYAVLLVLLVPGILEDKLSGGDALTRVSPNSQTGNRATLRSLLFRI